MRGALLNIVLPFTLILSQFAYWNSNPTSPAWNSAKTATQKPTPAAPWLKMNSGDGLLVINEVDYDQAGQDIAEFIEIKNISTTPVDLSAYAIQLIDAAPGPPYQSYPLIGILNPGDYYVLCGNNAQVPNCDQDITPNQNFIQNGAPDAILLLNTFTGIPEDALSYEGSISGVTEGSGAGLTDDPSFQNFGLSRVPDGTDTDSNNQDFVFQCITPGETNNDNQQPEIICPSDMVLYADVFCEALLPDFTNAAVVSDNCPSNVSISQVPPPGTEFMPGDYQISMTADDGSTIPVTCSFMITVLDTIPPDVTACPAQLDLGALPGACSQEHSFEQQGFTGTLAPLNWIWNPAGSLTTSFSFTGASDLTITSSNDNGNSCPPPFFHAAVLSTTTPVDGLVVFDWSYETFDSSPLFDPFGFAVNGSFSNSPTIMARCLKTGVSACLCHPEICWPSFRHHLTNVIIHRSE